MGTNVVQCLDCEQWNWEGIKRCANCGSTNLTIGFHQVLKILGIKKEDNNGTTADDNKL